MVNHVVDTWQVMCRNAWQRLIHVGHMAHLKAINMVLFIKGGRNKKEKEGKKKVEGKKGKKERKRKERERRRREKKKELASFPPTEDASTDGIHLTEKQSSSTRRQLRVGA